MPVTRHGLFIAFILAFTPAAWAQPAAPQPPAAQPEPGAEGETGASEAEGQPPAEPEPAPPEPEPAAPPPAPVPPPAGPPVAPPPPEDADGARFRGGVNAAFGGLFASKDPLKYTGFTGGVDGHIGVQIIDLIAIYAVPHIAFGKVTQKLQLPQGSADSSSGWLAITGTAVVDFTFIDQIYVGVGGGGTYAGPTCTNCQALGGGVLHIRAGGYPVMDFGEDGIRRKGLAIGVDLYVDFVSQLSATIVGGADTSIVLIEPMFTIGYEAY